MAAVAAAPTQLIPRLAAPRIVTSNELLILVYFLLAEKAAGGVGRLPSPSLGHLGALLLLGKRHA